MDELYKETLDTLDYTTGKIKDQANKMGKSLDGIFEIEKYGKYKKEIEIDEIDYDLSK